MPYGRPADTDPNTWYRAARKIDQVRLANEVFQSVSHSASFASLKTVSARPPPLSVAKLPLTPLPPVIPKPPLTTPSMGVPMDVDAARKARSLPLQGCYRCGDANHVVQDCPYCMDVHQLITVMGIKRFDYRTKVKTRSERRNLQTVSQLCTKQVGTGEINQIIESLLKVKVQRITKTY